MILGVHHPALAVPDLQRALDFYCGLLGFEPTLDDGKSVPHDTVIVVPAGEASNLRRVLWSGLREITRRDLLVVIHAQHDDAADIGRQHPGDEVDNLWCAAKPRRDQDTTPSITLPPKSVSFS